MGRWMRGGGGGGGAAESQFQWVNNACLPASSIPVPVWIHTWFGTVEPGSKGHDGTSSLQRLTMH